MMLFNFTVKGGAVSSGSLLSKIAKNIICLMFSILFTLSRRRLQTT